MKPEAPPLDLKNESKEYWEEILRQAGLSMSRGLFPSSGSGPPVVDDLAPPVVNTARKGVRGSYGQLLGVTDIDWEEDDVPTVVDEDYY